MDHAGDRVEVEGHDDPERHAVVGHRQRRFVVLRVRRDRDRVVAEAEAGPLEGGPVEVRIELVGDVDPLGRGGGGGVVLEVDLVGERVGRADEVLSSRSRTGRFWSWGRSSNEWSSDDSESQ